MNGNYEKLTPEITKITLFESKKDPIKWEKGMNAKIHWTCHAYVHSARTQEQNGHSHKDSEKNQLMNNGDKNHVHKDGCCSKSAQKSKIEMIENLLQGKPLKNESVKHASQMPSVPPKRTLISDSRKNDINPFQLRIGYSFSVKAMETCVKSMKVNEKSRFLCMPSPDLDQFLRLEQIMRQEKINAQLKAKGKPLLNSSGCSAHMSPEMLAISEGLEDAVGAIMEFEIELIDVENVGEFEKETWELSSIEKYELIPKYKTKGGEAYKKKDYTNSLAQYQKALELLEALDSSVEVIDLKKDRADLLKGIVNDSAPTVLNLEQIEEWMIQCRLNFAACKLKLHDYRSVIIQCTRVLELDPKSPKALFRRGQAYLELGRDLDLAQKDFDCLKLILPESEQGELHKFQQILSKKFRIAAEKEKKAFRGMF